MAAIKSRSLTKLILLVFLIGDACVEPLEIDVSYLTPRLVVEGEVSNLPGPYEVRLFYTTSIDSAILRPRPESGATVSIVDDEGNSEPLFENLPGIYRTAQGSPFQGQVGNSYFLRIQLENGEELVSTKQELRQEIPIDTVMVEFAEDAVIGQGQVLLDAMNVYVKSSVLVGRTDRVRWRFYGTFKGTTYPELDYLYDLRGRLVLAPPACSGIRAFGNSLYRVHECLCCVCWGTDTNPEVILSDDIPGNTQSRESVYLGTIPITGLRFEEKYRIEAQQVSLSSDVYNFWKLVKVQQSTGGDIFQPNAVKVRGNIKSVTNPDREVLGVFSVAGISSKSFFLYRSDIPLEIPEPEVIPDDCRKALPNGSTERPWYW